MAFRDTNALHEALAIAITDSGYKPLRIDRHEYIGGVMDEILARIRKAVS